MLILTIFDFLASVGFAFFAAIIVVVFALFTILAAYGAFHISFDKELSRSDRNWTLGILTLLTLWGGFLTYQGGKMIVLLGHHISHLVQ